MKMHDVVNNLFMSSLDKLCSLDVPVNTATKIMNIADSVNTINKKHRELKEVLVGRFGVTDDDGKLVREELDGDKYQIPIREDASEQFDKEYRKILDDDVELDTIQLSELGDVKLSAIDLLVLKDIITK